MDIEIEIKLIIDASAVAKLPQWLSAWPTQHSAGRQLTNVYFDTDDNQLRRWDMGLRLRGFDERYEMTLKVQNDAVGGLHQRQEYNVPLTQPQLDLSLLPEDIWPAGTDFMQVQERLVPLFSTHFVRETWLVTYPQCEVEVALDRGEVVAGVRQQPLQEIELELKSGERSALLAFAMALACHDGLRMTSLSKAARGYSLAQDSLPQSPRALPILRPAKNASAEEGMLAALQLALSQWQYHEELWLQGNAEAINDIRQALKLVSDTFSLYSALVPHRASATLRQALASLEARIESEAVNPEQCCFSAVWLTPKILLIDWLISGSWRIYVSEKAVRQLQGPFKPFADIMLTRTAAALRAMFTTVLQPGQYQDKLSVLQHHLRCVRLLAGSYPPHQAEVWLEHWTALEQAIITAQEQILGVLARRAVKQLPFWQ